MVEGFEHDAGTVLASKFYEVTKSCWQTEHLFSPMIVVIGRRSMERIPASLRPAFLKAVRGEHATGARDRQRQGEQRNRRTQDEGHDLLPDVRGRPLHRPRRKCSRACGPSFAKQYPATAPMFDAIAKVRA